MSEQNLDVLKILWNEYKEQWEHLDKFEQYKRPNDPMYVIWRIGKALDVLFKTVESE
jgi:hypothetical protein